jgi:CheY-like chemotaxis protein
MVHGLAAQLGGAFVLSSAVGEGTRADLYLPVAGGHAASVADPATQPLVERGRALSILLTDDEQIVRIGTAEMIRDLGHQVVEAASGAEALAKLAAGLEVDVVITDYKMPRMDGAELAQRIRERHPGIAVLLITGYTGSTEDTLDLPRLSKPFGHVGIANALAALVRPDERVVRIGRRRPVG